MNEPVAPPIVVGVDGSEASIQALEEALPIAHRRGAEIVMVSATPNPDHGTGIEWLSPGAAAGYRDLLTSQLTQSRQELADIRDRFKGEGARISLSFASGDAERALAEVAESCGAELIVVGPKGKGRVDRFLLGSVAERVSRYTSCDVLVARGSGRPSGYSDIVVTTDFFPAAEGALEKALDLAFEKARVRIYHCVSIPPSVEQFATSEVIAEMEHVTVARLEEVAEAVRQRGFDAHAVFGFGYPPEKIRDEIDDADLVVVGSRGRKGVWRFLLGSVAEKIVRHAPCSVYVSREKSAI